MTLVLDPHNAFKRGLHHALEIDPARLQALREAIAVARSYGDAGPLAELLRSWDPESLVTSENFFDAEDGYPTHKWLDHQAMKGLRVEETSDFGIGMHGALVAGDLVVGSRLVDEEEPVSPEWLETNLELDRKFHTAEATHLLAYVDFNSGLDRDAISDVSEAMDQGMGSPEASLQGHGDLTLDVDQLERELIQKLHGFRKKLEEIGRRDGMVMQWFAEQTAF